MTKYSRVTREIRCQIFALLKSSLSVPKIAELLGFHKTTIYREIHRNSVRSANGAMLRYDPAVAHKRAKQRYSKCRRNYKIQGGLGRLVTEKLEKSWSPEQISGRMKLEGAGSISHETIYRFTRRNRSYRRYLKFFNKRGAGRQKQRRRRESWVKTIHQRPVSAKNRSRFGHWERDGMYGANRKQLLVCVELKSRFTKIGYMQQGTSKYVGELTEHLLKQTPRKILTITNDNGSEFRKPMAWDIPVYYCDPLKPQQRGCVENTIGMLRPFVRRKTDLEKLGIQGVKSLEEMINNRPRKVLGYRTPSEIFYDNKVALVSGI